MPAPTYATEIAQLEAGLASGEAKVRQADGAEVTYRGASEIRNALAYFQSKAADAAAGGQASGVTYASFRRD